jgi:hypothetical protein
MATAEESAQAVIISGPRKGEFITLPGGEQEITPAEETLVASLMETAASMAENARAAAAEAEALLRDVRQVRSDSASQASERLVAPQSRHRERGE